MKNWANNIFVLPAKAGNESSAPFKYFAGSHWKESRYQLIWQAFLSHRYQLVLTDEIIFEYEEILQEHAAPGADKVILKISFESANAVHASVYYHWNAITNDPDDNKFFDAAIAAGADYLVTNDNHFSKSKNIFFPKVAILTADAFLDLLLP